MNPFEWLFKLPLEKFADGRLVFLSRMRGELLLAILLIFAVVAWLTYRQVRSRVSGRARRALAGLRIALLVVVFFLLATPAIRTKGAPEKGTFTAVMIDTSRSMSIEDANGPDGKKVSRLDAAKRLLAGPEEGKGLIDAIARHSKVLVYEFGPSAARAANVRKLDAHGVFTNLFLSVRDVESELRGLPLAAVVMVSDGCRNTGGSPEDAAVLLRNRGAVLYTVGVGNPNPPKDYEVVRVFAPKKVWRNTALDAYVTVRHTDFPGPFEIQVRRGEEIVLTQKVQPTAEDGDLQRVRLTFTPDHTEGSATYRVMVPSVPEEKVTDNNFKDIVVEIQDDRLPVLYLEGSPRMEYRFLRRAMFRDRDFRLVGLLRLASDRFYIQGANPAEAYLSKGFPTTADQLFAFKAVVLGDIEAGYFTKEQLALLEEFVKERGGGLLMLGGVNSFGLGKYEGTPVAKMLPVTISARDGAYSDQEYTARPTAESAGHLIMRLSEDDDSSRLLWDQMPPLIGITPVGPLKQGAVPLLTQRPEDGGKTVLAVQNYGQGRTAAFTSGGSWYWQVSRPASDEFHEKFWKQMVRWLVVGAKERLSVATNADVYSRKDSVIIRATVRQKDLKPVNDATVIAKVTDPLGNVEEVPMYWTLSEPGVYQARYKPGEEGNYRLAARVDGWDMPPVETAFEVSEPFVEFSNAGRKDGVLATMAGLTGGQYFPGDQAAALPDRIAQAVEKGREMGTAPVDRELWDAPALFLLCLVLLSVEWIVRRKSGLA
jgi:uncharacterized membrane protein